jgi:hypothetical protein
MADNEKSCADCKFLWRKDVGYSNYTVLDIEVRCAIGANPNLPADEPWDWKRSPDNWPKTSDSRCARHEVGPQVHIDVDEDYSPENFTCDAEVIAAVKSDMS